MEHAVKREARGWTWIAIALVAMLGVVVMVLGVKEHRIHLLFGGAMLLLVACALWMQDRAFLPGREEALPSNAEKAAWSQLGVGLVAILVLGGISLGSMQGSMASYLFFCAYVVIVAFYPVFRRRFVEANLRHRDVPEDERDRAIRAQGDYLSKRLLEFALVGLAILWVLVPQFFRSLGGPLQVAALLMLPILAANVAGEGRVALLHWRDRQ